MSAWIVSKRHIDALVTGIVGQEVGRAPNLTADEIGQVLWAENHKSVNYRYNEDTPVPVYTWERVEIDASSLLKQLHCYAYQSCEHLGWSESSTKKWIDNLANVLDADGVGRLAAYNSAPWGID